MAELLYGSTIEYWKYLYFDKKLTYKEMSYMLNVSPTTICHTVGKMGWKREIKRKVCAKADKSQRRKSYVTPELIKSIADETNMSETEVSDALYGLTSNPRNIDAIICEYGKKTAYELNKIRSCTDCERCDVDDMYCRRGKFAHEYNCQVIIDAWLQEPAKFAPGFVSKDVKDIIL